MAISIGTMLPAIIGGAGSLLGGKGGDTSTQTMAMDPAIKAQMEKGFARGDYLNEIGYKPYMGPEVAALNQQQLAGMQGANDMSAAFGGQAIDVAGMQPQAQEFAGGIMGYGSHDLYEQTKNAWEERYPGQAAAYNAMFMDPVTGDPSIFNQPGEDGGGGSGGKNEPPNPLDFGGEGGYDKAYNEWLTTGTWNNKRRENSYYDNHDPTQYRIGIDNLMNPQSSNTPVAPAGGGDIIAQLQELASGMSEQEIADAIGGIGGKGGTI